MMKRTTTITESMMINFAESFMVLAELMKGVTDRNNSPLTAKVPGQTPLLPLNLRRSKVQINEEEG
jgi:hypothetical protein